MGGHSEVSNWRFLTLQVLFIPHCYKPDKKCSPFSISTHTYMHMWPLAQRADKHNTFNEDLCRRQQRDYLHTNHFKLNIRHLPCATFLCSPCCKGIPMGCFSQGHHRAIEAPLPYAGRPQEHELDSRACPTCPLSQPAWMMATCRICLW